jgi:hypothetical protein
MVRIKKAIPLEDYRLRVTFDTGEEGVFSLRGWLDGPIFSKLKDKETFSHVSIDEIAGTVCWPNGIDLCPDVVYEQTNFSEASVREAVPTVQPMSKR